MDNSNYTIAHRKGQHLTSEEHDKRMNCHSPYVLILAGNFVKLFGVSICLS